MSVHLGCRGTSVIKKKPSGQPPLQPAAPPASPLPRLAQATVGHAYNLSRSAIQNAQIQPAEALGVCEDVDLDDLVALDRHAKHRYRVSVRRGDESRRSVDKHRPREPSEPGEAERLTCHRPR